MLDLGFKKWWPTSTFLLILTKTIYKTFCSSKHFLSQDTAQLLFFFVLFLFVFVFVCLFVRWGVCLFVCLFVCWVDCLSVCLFCFWPEPLEKYQCSLNEKKKKKMLLWHGSCRCLRDPKSPPGDLRPHGTSSIFDRQCTTLNKAKLVQGELDLMLTNVQMCVVQKQIRTSKNSSTAYIIVGFFIPVSSLEVFGHSIHSERRRIYLGKSKQALQNDTLSYHDYSVSGSPSQQSSSIP